MNDLIDKITALCQLVVPPEWTTTVTRRIPSQFPSYSIEWTEGTEERGTMGIELSEPMDAIIIGHFAISEPGGGVFKKCCVHFPVFARNIGLGEIIVPSAQTEASIHVLYAAGFVGNAAGFWRTDVSQVDCEPELYGKN